MTDPLNDLDAMFDVGPRYSFGDAVTASAWTADDLARWRWCIDALREYAQFKLALTCDCCGHKFERTITLHALRGVTAFLQDKLANVGQGATPWFQ